MEVELKPRGRRHEASPTNLVQLQLAGLRVLVLLKPLECQTSVIESLRFKPLVMCCDPMQSVDLQDGVV